MFTRLLTVLALVFFIYPVSLVGNADDKQPLDILPHQEPCFAKKIPQLSMLPANIPIILVMGHEFRNKDKCVPLHITFTWSNNYVRGDGYTHYSLDYVQTFPGELWYRVDKEEFTITANPAHWQGTSMIRKFKGHGQLCKRFDNKNACTELQKFDPEHTRAKKIVGNYLSSLSYSYPAVTTHGQKVPVSLHAISTLFEFINYANKWSPDGGHIKINNPNLVSFDFRELVTEASRQGVYSTTIQYNNNNEPENASSGHKGRLGIKLDFDQRCEGDDRSDMDPCKQVQELLSELKSALDFRDSYMDALPLANSDKHLAHLVADGLQLRNPYKARLTPELVEKNSGYTNPVDLSIHVPDYCDECEAKPYCKWEGDIVRKHEEDHKEYFQNNQHARSMLGDQQYRERLYPGDAQRHKAVARIRAEMEIDAYNQMAKYIHDMLNAKISDSGCTFSPEFLVELADLAARIH